MDPLLQDKELELSNKNAELLSKDIELLRKDTQLKVRWVDSLPLPSFYTQLSVHVLRWAQLLSALQDAVLNYLVVQGNLNARGLIGARSLEWQLSRGLGPARCAIPSRASGSLLYEAICSSSFQPTLPTQSCWSLFYCKVKLTEVVRLLQNMRSSSCCPM